MSAALVEGTALRWAGRASYVELADLSEVIARLAGESGQPVKRVRVGLGREVVQVRTVRPAPPIKARDVPQYVELELGRLFRKNGVPLTASGALIQVTKAERALWAAATPEPLLRAIADGCEQAGMRVEAMAPSSETLPAAIDVAPGIRDIVVPNGTTTETLSVGVGGVWRSRWSRGVETPTGGWVPTLGKVHGDAAVVAPAYAAGVRLPTLSLLPEGHRAARRRTDRRRIAIVAAAGSLLWFLAGVIYVGRLSLAYSRATTLLHAFQGAADSAVVARRNLDEGEATLATMTSVRAHRSRTLVLLGALTKALPESVTVIALQVGADGMVRITGFAPRAAQVVSQVNRLPGLSGAALDGAVTRQPVPGVGDRDRFTIVVKEERP